VSWRRRLRFTREGKYFVALTLGIGFAAINTGNNLLYLMLGAMLSLIIGSGILSELTLRKLVVSRREPERIFANRPFLLGLTLKNEKGRLPSLSIEVEDVLAGKPLARKCYFLKVPARGEQLASYRHGFTRRGQYRLEEVRLKTRFPFALFEKTRTVALASTLVVYPEVHPVGEKISRYASRGEEQHGRAGRRGEFLGLREYRDGDDLRDVFWRKSARVGRMLVREHEEPRGRRVAIVLDNALQREIETRERVRRQEQAVSHAASLAVHYLNQGYRVALLSRTAVVGPAYGPGQVDRILSALALVSFVEPSEQSALPPLPADHLYVSVARAAEPAERIAHAV
jgi:uncharacterized protein (DUF58 family)